MPQSQPMAAGSPRDRFPATRQSLIEAVAAPDPATRRAAWDVLVRAYWKPVYKYVRIQWNASEEDARDLTQEFFARAIEGDWFDRYDPARARFRTYLRACLQRFLSNRDQAAKRLKRGGGAVTMSLEFGEAEQELVLAAPGALDPDAFFRAEAVRSLFALALDDLRALGRPERVRVFEAYDLAPEDSARPSYASIATQLGIPVTQVTNHLHWCRRELRRLVLERLRELCATEAEFRAEAIEVLGVDP